MIAMFNSCSDLFLGPMSIINWDDIKDNPPAEMKVSPLSAVPHKSRLWRAILDLSYSLRLDAEKVIPSVNESSTKTGHSGAVNQLEHLLQRIIHTFATVPEDAKVFSAKWDVKDGFWRVVGTTIWMGSPSACGRT